MDKDTELFHLCFGPVRHEEACSELHGKLYKPALRYVRCLLQKSQCTREADDIIQKAWLSLSEIKEIQHITNFPAYFFSAVRNKVLEFFRRGKVRHVQNHVSLEDCVVESPNDFDPFVLEKVITDENLNENFELMELVLSLDSLLITYLKPRAFQAFQLWIVQNLSLKEIAEILQYSEKTIQRDIAEAFEIVNKYKDYFFENY